VAVLDRVAVREPAEGREDAGVGLGAVQVERRGDGQVELVAAVRARSGRGSSRVEQHRHGPPELGEPVAQRRVHLQDVAVGAEPAVADEVAGLLEGQQVLARRQRALVPLGQPVQLLVVEGVPGLLVPAQRVGAERVGVGEGLVELEAPVRVHREVAAVGQHVEDGLDAPPVLVQRSARRSSSSPCGSPCPGTTASRPAAPRSRAPGSSSHPRRRPRPARRVPPACAGPGPGR
jgi:hypothetical protein